MTDQRAGHPRNPNEPRTPSSHDPATIRVLSVVPQLVCDDVHRAAEFYRDMLGFSIDFIWGSPPSFASVTRDVASLNFKRADPPGTGRSNREAGGVDAYLCVSHVDALAEELRQRGARILYGPRTQSYGMRELTVEDCNGFVLVFGEATEC